MTPTDEQVERVADAIDAEFDKWTQNKIPPTEDLARAAIAAMPEPSHSQISALDDASNACLQFCPRVSILHAALPRSMLARVQLNKQCNMQQTHRELTI